MLNITKFKQFILPVLLLLSVLLTNQLPLSAKAYAEQIDPQQFAITTLDHGMLHTAKKITYYNATGQIIGYLHYDRFPFAIFVIHSFFISPNNRQQGHGTALLQFTCQQLKCEKAHYIVIQPGPFEQDQDKLIDVIESEKNTRLATIIRLYQKAGFRPAPNMLKYCAKYLYKLMGIDENSEYLMVL